MNVANRLAIAAIAVVLVWLAASPSTRSALRADMLASAGQPISSYLLHHVGVKPDQLPLNGLGPHWAPSPGSETAGSSEFSVRLADATSLGGARTWSALQALTRDFPNEPVAHAALARFAYVTPKYWKCYADRDKDAAILLASCEIGERLEPDNAFFPAMAVIGHCRSGEEKLWLAALRRAARKTVWRDYADAEANGSIRTLEARVGFVDSPARVALVAATSSPPYESLQDAAFVVIVRAESSGDRERGLALRRDVARLGEIMREGGTTKRTTLAGGALLRTSQAYSGGVILSRKEGETDDDYTARHEAAFDAYLRSWGRTGDAQLWLSWNNAARKSHSIVERGSPLSVVDPAPVLDSLWRQASRFALWSALLWLVTLASLSETFPSLARRFGRGAPWIVVGLATALLLWQTWCGLSVARDLLAQSGLAVGVAPEVSEAMNNRATVEAVTESATRGFFLIGLALVGPMLCLAVMILTGVIRRVPIGGVLRSATLPIGAIFALIYAAQVTTAGFVESKRLAELDSLIRHEGRYLAAKLGEAWPVLVSPRK